MIVVGHLPCLSCDHMKQKNSGSISDSEQLNFLEEEEEETESHLKNTDMNLNLPSFNINNIVSPFSKDLEDFTKVTIFSSSPPTPNQPPPNVSSPDPANHDKIYYDDRYNESVFDPSLARSSLPKILISISGMLLTGFFLNNIIVLKD